MIGIGVDIHPHQERLAAQVGFRQEPPEPAVLAIAAIITHDEIMPCRHRPVTIGHADVALQHEMWVILQAFGQFIVAGFARTLAVTFRAGVPLVEALDNVAGATGNTVYSKAVMRMKEDVAVGYPVNMAMKQVNLFPHMVVQMTAIGEEAGALDAMLLKVAEFYEEEVNNAVDALSSLIEPMVMVIIGGLVGSIVIAMYLPIFKIAMTVMG